MATKDSTVTTSRRRQGDALIGKALTTLDARLREPGTLLGSPAAVSDYLRLRLVDLEHEIFGVLWMDNQNRLIEYDELFRGTLTQTSVFPREIVKQGLLRNAAAAILVHNHPSGVAEASSADMSLTHGVKAALALVDIKVADHFIVARKEVLSFAAHGMLDTKLDVSPSVQAQTEQSVKLEDDEFAAANGLYKVVTSKPGAAKDQLTARLAQLESMLTMVTGEGLQAFTLISDVRQDNYLWGCLMMVEECRQLARIV
ncbi:putative DNA binding protein, possibly associated to lesions; CP4-6 prophage (modular protein) [Georgfuchsia toluolica]|uniref:DNA binding protein, possibly associated to lesions CP4-6 prophage (Modular protein) n=1 Tax=Georgfuchsia toluolica TaxID=424218 RepID=A0A916NHV7_9PROT|nr:JAB domain-containing protein [Georgfuchsia toluolica]CAG4883811.1 putative DNA binding protein, possibly associated to lesions; CP4-6 prophage (modular protein) [Georgfuchsia toluolica]